MKAELETELGYEKQERRLENVETDLSKNYRNGYSKKRVKTQIGEVEINVPRDRNGEYEPQIISKYSRNAAGMSTRDISEQVKNLYDIEISPELKLAKKSCHNSPNGKIDPWKLCIHLCSWMPSIIKLERIIK